MTDYEKITLIIMIVNLALDVILAVHALKKK